MREPGGEEEERERAAHGLQKRKAPRGGLSWIRLAYGVVGWWVVVAESSLLDAATPTTTAAANAPAAVAAPEVAAPAVAADAPGASPPATTPATAFKLLKAALAAATAPKHDTLKLIHHQHFDEGIRDVIAGRKVMKQSLFEKEAPALLSGHAVSRNAFPVAIGALLIAILALVLALVS